MPARCRVFRGLVKEVEEDIDKFLSARPVHVLHMAQSESRDHISVTLLFEACDRAELDHFGEASAPKENRE